MNYQYKAKNAEEIEAILLFYKARKYTYATGFEAVGYKTNIKNTAEHYFKNFPVIVIFSGRKHIGGNSDLEERYKTINFNQVFLIKEDKTVDVVLSSEYTATVSKDGIKIGDKTFDLNIVEKLAEAKKQISR